MLSVTGTIRRLLLGDALLARCCGLAMLKRVPTSWREVRLLTDNMGGGMEGRKMSQGGGRG